MFLKDSLWTFWSVFQMNFERKRQKSSRFSWVNTRTFYRPKSNTRKCPGKYPVKKNTDTYHVHVQIRDLISHAHPRAQAMHYFNEQFIKLPLVIIVDCLEIRETAVRISHHLELSKNICYNDHTIVKDIVHVCSNMIWTTLNVINRCKKKYI